jgi:catechol 2,3-dioxygenase-like lactoylglutathione lyase family enzyme
VLESLDHIVIAVADLDAARRTAIALLGRSPSWSGSHPGLGTRNVLFRLENGYVELLAPDRERERAGEGVFGARLEKWLGEHGPGLYALALGTRDAEAESARLRAAGLRAGEPAAGLAHDEASGAFRRYRNVFLPADDTHGVGLFVIEHQSAPELLPPALPVGADAAAVSRIDHVVVRTREPERALRLYGEQLGIRLALDRSFEQRGVRLMFFRIGGATIEIAAPLRAGAELGEPSGARDELWGVAYQVPDLDAAHARLVAAGLATTEVRTGHKPGTRVCTVQGEPLGVPTLVIEPAPRASRGAAR